LLPPPGADTAPRTTAFRIHVEPIAVPPENDQAAWLVRVSPSEVTIFDSERWAAPLNDELHAAFVEALQRQLGVEDSNVSSDRNAKAQYDVKIAVRRFESVLGEYALIEADWAVQRDGMPALSCQSRVSEEVAKGFAALASGHQRAVETIATKIAAAVRSMEAGTPAC
jgi:uncharacterized lipoprotein YmbA